MDAAHDHRRQLRVMENYLFYEPLLRLKAAVDSGALGTISGYHLKMVASGRGGWEVPGDTYRWQFEQARRGRGVLLFDDDWASSFRDSGRHWLRWLRTGEGPLLWGPEDALDVLRFALAAYESDANGGVGVDPRLLA